MARSPMMTQYLGIKEKYLDCILFFRLGDFYEMFYEDAKIASKELELVLTGKNCGEEERAPMCGVPFHAAENYIAKLVDRGYKVAICEQMEDAALAKGIVRREVVQVVTPGTVIASAMLLEKENNFIAACYFADAEGGLAYSDISTGEMNVTTTSGPHYIEMLINELVKISPREVLLYTTKGEEKSHTLIENAVKAYIHNVGDSFIGNQNTQRLINEQFPQGIRTFGLSQKDPDTIALGMLLKYIKDNQRSNLSHINHVNRYYIGNHMALDKSTIRNLELTESFYERDKQGSLLGILDRCNTAMGSRKMKRWIREPLNQKAEIDERLEGVNLLYNEIILRNNLREYLKGIYDLERLVGRIAMGNANGRDLLALGNSISNLPDIKLELKGLSAHILTNLGESIDPLEDVSLLIERAIEDDCPVTIKDGGLIKTGYSEELDSLKDSIKGGQQWIASLEGTERERTGIKNLKVGFNKVFGYYLEITKSNYHQIPENYIRKQTLVNCERFITPELKEMEAIVLGAETKIYELEHQLFTEIREYIEEFIPVIQRTGEALATLDVLCSFAEVSTRQNYVRPQIKEDDLIQIKEGRHPVIEDTIKDGIFVANESYMDRQDDTLLLLTGPNMSGKSTYMRQVALIVLMAQIGCFVPCNKAEIGICDQIFTRIGASDNLSLGQSTFFVEMSELAYILNNATSKSLILLDEIGRGTSTYDGLSIAWAAAEYILEKDRKIRTLFATHYHEMTELEGNLEGFRNLNVEVKEEDGHIVFLHQIGYGSSSRSYGIHVAELAGVPQSLLDRATEKLKDLETIKG